MSLEDENKMLYILHRNGVSRSNIKWIMDDLKESNVFYDPEYDDYESDWDFLEKQAFWLFDSDASNEEKLDAIKNIRVKQDEFKESQKSQYSLEQGQRVQDKIKELVEKGIIDPYDESDPFMEESKIDSITRYGRSPLHEAIAMRDIRLVKKYLKVGKYMDSIDNNGHTAMEMAYYDNYKEALILFQKYMKKGKNKVK